MLRGAVLLSCLCVCVCVRLDGASSALSRSILVTVSSHFAPYLPTQFYLLSSRLFCFSHPTNASPIQQADTRLVSLHLAPFSNTPRPKQAPVSATAQDLG
jgi:hypothetical protein